MAKTYDELVDMILEYTAPEEPTGDLMEEAGNLDLMEIKNKTKLMKSTIKDMKKAYKGGHYQEAKEAGERLLKDLAEYKEQFKQIDQSFGDSIMGNMLGGTLNFIKDFALGLATLGIGAFIAEAKRLSASVMHILKASKSGENMNWKVFNTYANDVLTLLEDTERQINKIIKKCDEELGQKPTAESASVDDALDDKLAIYEAARAGEISEEDRDELLKVFDETPEDTE